MADKNKLTKSKAIALAEKVLGTSKGLELDAVCQHATYKVYRMQMGDFRVTIRPELYEQWLWEVVIVGPVGNTFALYDPVTMEEDYHAEESRRRRERCEALEEWVFTGGPGVCIEQINEIWARR